MTGAANDHPPKRITDPVRRRAVRHWRIVTLVYFVALTTGTHWPELRVGVGPGPPPDKVLHLLAFGGLTLLVWQCRLFKRIWQAGLACALWVLFDEWTQSLAILNRSSSWADVIAGELGVLCGVMWIGATAPVGGPVARLWRKQFDQHLEERLSSWRRFIELLIRSIIFGFVAVVIGVVFGISRDRDPFITAIIAFSIAFIFGVHATFAIWWRTHPSGQRIRHDIRMDGLGAGCLSVLAFTVVAGVIASFIPAVSASLESIPRTMESVAGLFACIVLTSLLVFVARLQIARRIERVSHRCVVCEYDLRGQPDNESGRCPECGTPFVRLSKPKSDEADA